MSIFYVILFFICCWISLVTFCKYVLQKDAKWSKRLCKAYDKEPCVKRALMLTVFNPMYYEPCKYKRFLKTRLEYSIVICWFH